MRFWPDSFVIRIACCSVCTACHTVLAAVLVKKVEKFNGNINPDIQFISLALGLFAWILTITQQPSFFCFFILIFRFFCVCVTPENHNPCHFLF